MAEWFFDFQFEGIDQLEAAFDELGAALSKQVLQTALKKAGQVLADAASAGAPRDERLEPGTRARRIAESFVVRTALPKNQRRLRAKAGSVRQFAEVFIFNTAPHAHLVEFGHKLVVGKRATTRRGRRDQVLKVIGHVPAHPFARPAWDATGQESFRVFKDEVWKVLAATAKRLAKQAETGKLSRKSALSLASSIENEGD